MNSPELQTGPKMTSTLSSMINVPPYPAARESVQSSLKILKLKIKKLYVIY